MCDITKIISLRPIIGKRTVNHFQLLTSTKCEVSWGICDGRNFRGPWFEVPTRPNRKVTTPNPTRRSSGAPQGCFCADRTHSHHGKLVKVLNIPAATDTRNNAVKTYLTWTQQQLSLLVAFDWLRVKIIFRKKYRENLLYTELPITGFSLGNIRMI